MEEGELGAVSSWWLGTPRKRGRGQEDRGWDTDPGDIQGMSGQEVSVKEMKKMSIKLGWKPRE